MSSRVEFQGLEEFRQQLRHLPAELAAEGSVIVQAQAEAAGREIQAAYGERTGNLKSRVRIILEVTQGGVIATVLSAARHSHLYEFGTRDRRTTGGLNRGRMPAADVTRRMIPIAIKRRRIMMSALMDLVRRQGFEVVVQ